jgi:hypothetical protein
MDPVGEWIDKSDAADMLGVSSRTMQRRLETLAESHPELVQRSAGRTPARIAFAAIEQGLLGEPKTAATTSTHSPTAASSEVRTAELEQQVGVAQATSAAFEADNDRLRAELELRDAEATIDSLRHELTASRAQNEMLTGEVARLRAAIGSLIGADTLPD